MRTPRDATAFQASALRDDRTRSGVYTTTETVLAAYADPGVLASAAGSDLRPECLLDGGYHTAQFLLFGLVLGLWH